MPHVYIGVGSNIDPRTHVAAALDRLAGQFGELQLSPVYESEAIGFDGAPFLNMVVGLFTDQPLGGLLAQLREIERDNGYRGGGAKFSARSLDLDLLTYGDCRGLIDGIELPRADITAYAYVLWPLADMAGAELHPALGISFLELRHRFAECQNLRPVSFVWRGRELSAAVLDHAC